MRADDATATRSTEKFDSVEQEVFLNLWRTYDVLRSIEDEVFAAVGITAQQYNALRLLRSVHPGTMPTLVLGRKLISRAPDMTRLVDRLENAGLLTRERRSDNRRVVEVGITAQGIELLRQTFQAVQDCHARQLGHMDAKLLRQLSKLLKQARAPHERVGDRSFVDD